MSQEIVRINYPEMDTIGRMFTDCMDCVQQLYNRVNIDVARCAEGAWAGHNATIFYNRMDETIMPAIHRLSSALDEAQNVTQEISRIFQAAENEAAQYFRYDVPLVETMGSGGGGAPDRRRRRAKPPAQSDRPQQGDGDGRSFDPDCSGAAYTYYNCTWDLSDANPESVATWAENNPDRADELLNDAEFADWLSTTDPTIASNTLGALMNTPAGSFLINDSAITITASGLVESIQRGDTDAQSVIRLVSAARNEVGWSYSPSGAALYAIAMADAQGDNWIEWEDNNVVPMIYFGSSYGVYHTYADAPGGGNCAAFVSMAYWVAGMDESSVWGVGGPDTRHIEARANAGVPAIHDAYNAGVTTPDGNRMFTGAGNLSGSIWQLSTDATVIIDSSGLGINNSVPHNAETRSNIINNLSTGDLIFSNDNFGGGARDHVSIVVGWGDPNGGAGSPFYPTLSEAQSAGIVAAVPYAIDHGGTSPQTYPRPWTQTVTTNNTELGPLQEGSVRIDAFNLEPTN
jgi:WXG100 family type VII secretion target